jgi:hypothetical protein
MKGERKLRLVHGGRGEAPRPPATPHGDEPPFTAEELAAATALREALDGDLLAQELRAAYGPPALLGEPDLDALVTRALGDESAATSVERAAAERLRAELAGEAQPGPEAELLRAVKLAAQPTPLAAERNEALIEAALRAPLRQRGPQLRRIAPLTMAALAGVAALAAGAALMFDRGLPAPASATAALVRARSADDLFDATTPFPRRGGESARIDRIASARAADLRQNRFAAWGVR